MNHSEQFLKRRKFLLLLPVIVWPFAMLLFWLLGGGGVEAANGNVTRNGLNMQLPDAKVKQLSTLDKMSFYAFARQDSVKKVALAKIDPNLEEPEEEVSQEIAEKESRVRISKVRERAYQPARKDEGTVVPRSRELDELQSMVATLQKPKADLELEALNGTLQQLVELQKPKKSEEAVVANRKVFRVYAGPVVDEAGFFGESGLVKDSAGQNEISAVVHGEQLLQNGSVIKLRLVSPVVVDGQLIPAGVFVFGLAGILNERLIVEISSIQFNGRIYPVSMKVFDLDGIEGIYIPGSMSRDVAKQAVEQGVQSVGIVSIDQSLKTQAAAAGIGAAKTLLSRKATRVRVTIKSGYKVLLRDEKRRDG